MSETVLQRIKINNILAFMIVLGYVGTWTFAVVLGAIEPVPDGETRLAVVLDSIESMQGILGTQTVITILVVQHYFRKHKSERDSTDPDTPTG